MNLNNLFSKKLPVEVGKSLKSQSNNCHLKYKQWQCPNNTVSNTRNEVKMERNFYLYPDYWIFVIFLAMPQHIKLTKISTD